MVKFSQFFKYIKGKDKFLLIVGSISAVCCGISLPSMAIIVGEVTNTFDPRKSSDDILDTMSNISGWIAIIGAIQWVMGYLYYAFWQHLAENVSFDLRSRYLSAVLRQEVAFFEKSNVEQLPT